MFFYKEGDFLNEYISTGAGKSAGIRKLLAQYHVDSQSGCLYRYIKSETERLVLHCHDYFEIFLTLKGTLIHTANGKSRRLSEGSLVFVRDFDCHGYESDGVEFEVVNLAFTCDTLMALFDYLSEGFCSEKLLSAPFPPTVTLSANDKNKLFSKLSELNTINFSDKKTIRTEMRKLLLEIFVKYFSDFTPYSETQISSEKIPFWLENCCEKMRRPANFISGIDKFYELSGKSHEHATRCMRKYYGVSPTEYINDLRITYAANLLLSSNLSVTDICYECGFMNISHFYDLFKAKYMMTPKEFYNTHCIYPK